MCYKYLRSGNHEHENSENDIQILNLFLSPCDVRAGHSPRAQCANTSKMHPLVHSVPFPFSSSSRMQDPGVGEKLKKGVQ